jgi:ATP-dependent RNA helicase RhlE
LNFDQFGLDPRLMQGVRSAGFSVATPIQAAAIPPALAGHDLIGTAQTGTGKTAAFVLPILQRLLQTPRGRGSAGCRALIVTPTRELAAQIEDHVRQLAVHTPIQTASVFGGVGMGPQEHAFRAGVDVLVATPGRLLDHFRHPYARLEKLEVLVLDEADRMLDMGFLPDIRRVLKHLPPNRQTLFFSATMPPPIAALAREILHEPVSVNIERRAAPAVGITQAVYPVSGNLKTPLLAELLRRGDLENALVFTRTKHRANRLYEALSKRGVSCERIHGNRSQPQRTQALAGFKSGQYRVLVATDIAARGIDVEALPHVVNFDVPHVPEDYIHRVGRTARAERTGDAFTFVSPEEEGDLRAIEKSLGRRLPRITIPGFDYSAAPAERFEIPVAERIAAIRARKAEERARARTKEERRAATAATPPRRPAVPVAFERPGRPAAHPGPGRSRRRRSGARRGPPPRRP